MNYQTPLTEIIELRAENRFLGIASEGETESSTVIVLDEHDYSNIWG